MNIIVEKYKIHKNPRQWILYGEFSSHISSFHPAKFQKFSFFNLITVCTIPHGLTLNGKRIGLENRNPDIIKAKDGSLQT